MLFIYLYLTHCQLNRCTILNLSLSFSLSLPHSLLFSLFWIKGFRISCLVKGKILDETILNHLSWFLNIYKDNLLINSTKRSLSQCVCISNYRIAHFKYFTVLLIIYTSIKPGKMIFWWWRLLSAKIIFNFPDP